ncbi:MAG: hypothetical protein ACRDNK_23075, partial [Solirubrobacteraceae bacterium]
QVLYLHEHGVVGSENWQTYAWSGGAWLPKSIAPLEQYLNGALYDNDRALASDYGQWPYTAPKPPDPRHYDWLPNTVRHFGPGNFARERNTVLTWDRFRCEAPARRAVCRSTSSHLRLLADRIAFVANHTGRLLKHTARKPRWTALHYRAGKHVTTLGGAFHRLARRMVARRPVADW